ncbi:DUF262 domain-containing protein [Asticcacaulis sp. YBE204]|uniref:DUF262 domain-containing protein n=1 Tax=Asticcacaulis sp. YBE204 TaxID=1282363 RepID=UPI0003F9DFB5|nr:DUF262 domain-containing protein [Asticcacaulis sp. YBE204]
MSDIITEDSEHFIEDVAFDEDIVIETQDPMEDEGETTVTGEDFSQLIIAPSDWTVQTLHSQIGKQIDLDPEFQRRNVWNSKSKSIFIESLLLGIPIPQILLSSKPNQKNNFVVLDGKQRLLTIKEFIDGKLPNGRIFKLRNLRVLKDIEGKSWKDLEDDSEWSYRLLNETIRTAVIRGWKDERVLYEIFYRLNSGSVKLSPMELRMSLHPGEFLKFIIKWTEKPKNLHKILGKKASDPRMADVELAVRFLAFNMFDGAYRGDLKAFLDETCIDFNSKFSDKTFSTAVETALESMEGAIAVGIEEFGLKKFCRKIVDGNFETRFNRAIFDVLVGSMQNSGIRKFAKDHPGELLRVFTEVSSDNDFTRAVETTTKSTSATHLRFERWYKAVGQLTGIQLNIPDTQNESAN